MQSWPEEIGGARTEPRGDGTVPAAREPVAEHDQAASADDELASADDQAVAAENLPVPADHEAVAADDQAAAAENLPVPADHKAVAGDDQVAAESLPVAPDHPDVVADDQPVSADEVRMIVTVDNQDGAAAADDDGHATAGESEPDIAAVVPAGDAVPGGSPSAFASGDADDAPAGAAGIGGTPAPDTNQRLADEATPTTTAGFSLEPGSAQGAGSLSAAGRWPEIQAMFVDDPRASVELAAGLVDDSVEAFIASVKQLQSSLRSISGSSDADTEQLRKALQRYRSCWRHLHSISIEP